jgi:hypothetical protein
MSFNYHELTMNEPRDSPGRRKQYLLICTIGAGIFANSLINSGIFNAVKISEGVFPGGEFVYKSDFRDYAASASMIRSVAEEGSLKTEQYDDLLYTFYLDDTSMIPPGKQRFSGGMLLDMQQTKDIKPTLMALNEQKPGYEEDASAVDLYQKLLPYESVSVPSVDAAVANFPFTNGFVSALMHDFKVFPAMLKYAREHGEEGNHPVIATTCSIKQGMCTHYVPLVKGSEFLLGKPTTKDYLDSLPKIDGGIDWADVYKGLKKLLPFLK